MKKLSAMLCLALGCVDAGGAVALEVDEAGYAEHVHAYVEVGCATLDCHGDPGRPLRLFGEFGLRERGELRDQPMTASELSQNAWSFEGLEPADISTTERLAILKPLAESAGGLDHVGGDIFVREDAGYRCLVAWLDGRLAAEAMSCARAAEEVAPREPLP